MIRGHTANPLVWPCRLGEKEAKVGEQPRSRARFGSVQRAAIAIAAAAVAAEKAGVQRAGIQRAADTTDLSVAILSSPVSLRTWAEEAPLGRRREAAPGDVSRKSTLR